MSKINLDPNKKTLLIIEDGRGMVQLLKEAVGSRYNLLVCSSGYEALTDFGFQFEYEINPNKTSSSYFEQVKENFQKGLEKLGEFKEKEHAVKVAHDKLFEKARNEFLENLESVRAKALSHDFQQEFLTEERINSVFDVMKRKVDQEGITYYPYTKQYCKEKYEICSTIDVSIDFRYKLEPLSDFILTNLYNEKYNLEDVVNKEENKELYEEFKSKLTEFNAVLEIVKKANNAADILSRNNFKLVVSDEAVDRLRKIDIVYLDCYVDCSYTTHKLNYNYFSDEGKVGQNSFKYPSFDGNIFLDLLYQESILGNMAIIAGSSRDDLNMAMREAAPENVMLLYNKQDSELTVTVYSRKYRKFLKHLDNKEIEVDSPEFQDVFDAIDKFVDAKNLRRNAKYLGKTIFKDKNKFEVCETHYEAYSMPQDILYAQKLQNKLQIVLKTSKLLTMPEKESLGLLNNKGNIIQFEESKIKIPFNVAKILTRNDIKPLIENAISELNSEITGPKKERI